MQRTEVTDGDGEKEGEMLRTIFFYATEDVVYVVGEEAFGVKHRLDQAGDRTEGHLLVMRVFVPL